MIHLSKISEQRWTLKGFHGCSAIPLSAGFCCYKIPRCRILGMSVWHATIPKAVLLLSKRVYGVEHVVQLLLLGFSISLKFLTIINNRRIRPSRAFFIIHLFLSFQRIIINDRIEVLVVVSIAAFDICPSSTLSPLFPGRPLTSNKHWLLSSPMWSFYLWSVRTLTFSLIGSGVPIHLSFREIECVIFFPSHIFGKSVRHGNC